MNKRFVFVGIALVILSVMGIGCYTILTHPRVQGEEGEAIEHTGHYYREHCTDCHGDYHNYPYGFYYGYYPDYYWSQPRWGRYYAYPWWWDRYWWDDDDYYYYEEGDQAPVSSEKAERRMGIAPPYVRPSESPTTPFIVPSPTTGQETDQTQQPEKPEATKIEKKKEEQKQEAKAKRRKK